LEVVSGEYSYLPVDRVHFGPGSIAQLAGELDKIRSKRPFVITGQTIAEKTRLVDTVEKASGRKLAGLFSGIKQHAPISGIKQAVSEVQRARADSLISLGGGSPIDSTKIAVKELSESFAKPIITHLAIPTTLSAAEFSYSAGMTDDASKRKTGLRDPRLVPRFIFLDPKITVDTPSWLWACTGIRSLDHAVESVYSLKPNHTSTLLHSNPSSSSFKTSSPPLTTQARSALVSCVKWQHGCPSPGSKASGLD
jgi:alcohol dehydrogenase class IV